jgi:hypothetical protein
MSVNFISLNIARFAVGLKIDTAALTESMQVQ